MTKHHQQFVAWFRHASPYIHAHRGRTFVISFDGAAVESPGFPDLIHDIALLSSLGIRVVLVHGTRSKIVDNLQERGMTGRYADGLRITDAEALSSVKAACGQISANVQALLSMGLTNIPSQPSAAEVKTRITSGSFITARPVGVRDGIDFCYTGEVRRVDSTAIIQQLNENCIVLISPLGYSPTGEIFNLAVEDVASAAAIALHAAKWICLSENPVLQDEQGRLVSQLTLPEAQDLLHSVRNEAARRQIRRAMNACQNHVERVHLVGRDIDGGLLLELFSREGVGTMISENPFENMRRAVINDVGGVLELIKPLENAGILVRRSREKLEMEIGYFALQERDGVIVACAGLYPYSQESMAELACVAVHPDYQSAGRGNALLAFMEREAEQTGISKLFVLTTRAAHWFQERGFIAAELDDLPITRRKLYNYQRQSKVFIKEL
ncbi:MAG: amino-acid N-acetyltransferase [Gammaproteobacteria bacterium]|nr:amino-acid N-acetyltransferase [Gammaproteobacteria bacterium]